MNYTIKQIEQRLQTISDENDPFIKQCAQDERKGVQALLESLFTIIRSRSSSVGIMDSPSTMIGVNKKKRMTAAKAAAIVNIFIHSHSSLFFVNNITSINKQVKSPKCNK